LFSGLIIATIRLVLELNQDNLDPDGILYMIGSVNFLSFAAYMFLASVLIAVVVSLITPPPSEAKLSGLTFSTLSDEQKAENKASYSIWDILASLVVLALVVFIMMYFNGK
jgi:SSS family solute:Na+ symporter